MTPITTRHAARQFVRQHWQGILRTFSAPPQGLEKVMPPEGVQLINDIWADECDKMAERVDPTPATLEGE